MQLLKIFILGIAFSLNLSATEFKRQSTNIFISSGFIHPTNERLTNIYGDSPWNGILFGFSSPISSITNIVLRIEYARSTYTYWGTSPLMVEGYWTNRWGHVIGDIGFSFKMYRLNPLSFILNGGLSYMIYDAEIGASDVITSLDSNGGVFIGVISEYDIGQTNFSLFLETQYRSFLKTDVAIDYRGFYGFIGLKYHFN